MPADFRLELDASAIDDLAADAEAQELAQAAGDAVAANAAKLAPKRTGAGAASIHAEVEVDGEGAYADVSWDKDHFYMGFAEMGTERQAATPFLRPGLDSSSI